jgi:hypothetical protein
MLDVHPPEHPAHSWRDFFIHIGTICLGLLIAIGLEQAVEALHRDHQRHELLEQLGAEHRSNLKDAHDALAGANEAAESGETDIDRINDREIAEAKRWRAKLTTVQ